MGNNNTAKMPFDPKEALDVTTSSLFATYFSDRIRALFGNSPLALYTSPEELLSTRYAAALTLVLPHTPSITQHTLNRKAADYGIKSEDVKGRKVTVCFHEQPEDHIMHRLIRRFRQLRQEIGLSPRDVAYVIGKPQKVESLEEFYQRRKKPRNQPLGAYTAVGLERTA